MSDVGLLLNGGTDTVAPDLGAAPAAQRASECGELGGVGRVSGVLRLSVRGVIAGDRGERLLRFAGHLGVGRGGYLRLVDGERTAGHERLTYPALQACADFLRTMFRGPGLPNVAPALR